MKKQFTIFLILVFVLGLVPANFLNAQDLSNKLSGRILLQVEDVGQAWYIDPGTKQRAFLGRPADAFQIMRELGLGISEKDYNSFNGNAPKNLSGRILLRVEANGEAYYVNPTDLKMYYLGRPADAFKVMREKGLGITDEDLTTVPIFQKYKEQTEANTNAINSLSQIVGDQQKKISELEEKIDTNTSTSTNSCIADTWSCGAWSECSSGGQQTRACNLTFDCQSVNTPSPSTSQSCSYSSNNICTSWAYSNWGTCTSGLQTRTITSSSPSSCAGGTPVLSQSCTTQPSSCSSWIYSDWSVCQSNGAKTRTVISSSPNGCSGGSPILTESCIYAPPACTSWTYSDWNTCSSNGQQARSIASSLPNGCVNGSPALTQSCTYTPNYVMPDKPIIESFCDNKGNCVHSYVADSGASSSSYPYPTVHVGETLNFTIKVSGEETSGVLAFILPQEYDWVKEGGMKPWSTDLTYTKTFTTEDISARYFMYAYIKSSNDNYHRRSSGCNWTAYSCDDNSQIIYTVLP